MFWLVSASILTLLLLAWLIAAPFLYKKIFQRGWVRGYKAGLDESDESLTRMRVILERAGIHFDETYARAVVEDSETRSWTSEPVAPAQRVPPGSIPRWDEVQ